MKKIPPSILALLSGILLFISWQPHCTFLIFIALVPLFIATEAIHESITVQRKKLAVTGIAYLAFFSWNILTTWWIAYASFGGAAMAIVCNALLMCMVYSLYYNIKTRVNKQGSIWILIPLWLSFEYLHTDWDLTYTWLTIGNVFGFQNAWVQWYEYTGVSGGSLWVLAINILIYQLIQEAPAVKKGVLKKTSFIAALILVPILFSFFLSVNNKTIDPQKTNIVIVQPNVDPYNEKFYTEPEIQLNKLLLQVDGVIDSTTDYLVLPETFLTENMWEENIQQSLSVNFLKNTLIKKYPRLTIVSGANTFYAFRPADVLSSTAHKFTESDGYYDAFNSAIQIDSSSAILIYHKSKLVPGTEKMPFPVLFKPLEKLAIDMGGTTGSLGTQKERTVFTNIHTGLKIAPVICYESIYGEFVTEYIQKGANLIFIMTNDGWWEDTPGYHQHLAYGTLRAIETRRPIARSANTGISCIIDKYGNIEEPQAWWKPAIIRTKLAPENQLTFYVKYGDLISKTSLFTALAFILFALYLRFKKR